MRWKNSSLGVFLGSSPKRAAAFSYAPSTSACLLRSDSNATCILHARHTNTGSGSQRVGVWLDSQTMSDPMLTQWTTWRWLAKYQVCHTFGRRTTANSCATVAEIATCTPHLCWRTAKRRPHAGIGNYKKLDTRVTATIGYNVDK